MKVPTPFVERARPIILPLTMQPGEEDVAMISLHLARNTGSRLIVMRILNEALKTSHDYETERFIRDSAEEAGVPCEYLDVHETKTMATIIKETAEKTHADTIVIPVPRNIFLGGWHPIQATKWIEEFSNKKIILVSSPTRPVEKPHPPFRILIPVLHKFHQEPFELSGSLTSSSAIPDVDIIAAKVMEFPSNVPLYSLYYPESLAYKDDQSSLLKHYSIRHLQRHITPLTLYVQDVSRGIAKFIVERKVQMIILEGDWAAKHQGFLRKEERKIVKKAPCAIIVTLPHSTQQSNSAPVSD